MGKIKRNIDYYPHRAESHRHPKFRTLRALWGDKEKGWAMEGRFWALNNLIASAEDCKLNVGKLRNKGAFADELDMTIEEFTEFIETLKAPEIELVYEIEEGVITTDVVQETYQRIAGGGNNHKSAPLKAEDKKNIEQMKLLFKEYIGRTPSSGTALALSEIVRHLPKDITRAEVWGCVEDELKKISKLSYYKTDYLISNIRRCIAIRREQNIQKQKEKEAEQSRRYEEKRLKEIMKFLEDNQDKITPSEIQSLRSAIENKWIFRADVLIQQIVSKTNKSKIAGSSPARYMIRS